jgi:chemotaxis protein MotD
MDRSAGSEAEDSTTPEPSNAGDAPATVVPVSESTPALGTDNAGLPAPPAVDAPAPPLTSDGDLGHPFADAAADPIAPTPGPDSGIDAAVTAVAVPTAASAPATGDPAGPAAKAETVAAVTAAADPTGTSATAEPKSRPVAPTSADTSTGAEAEPVGERAPALPGSEPGRPHGKPAEAEASEPQTPAVKHSPADIKDRAADLAGQGTRAVDAKADPLPTTAAPAIQGGAPPATPAAPNPTQTPAAAIVVPIEGLAVEIAARAHGGQHRFEVRLDPPDLGRIDVRLHVDRHGQVTSHLVVDRIDTLDLLRRDAADLERSLQQAGLKTSDNGLQFSLRDQSLGTDAGSRDGGRMAQVTVPDNEVATPAVAMRGYLRPGLGSGIDIHV